MLSLHDFHVVTATDVDCRGWLRANGLLAIGMQCGQCGSIMEEKVYSRVADGVIWRCPPRQCRATISIRKGSFFEASHLPLRTLADVIYYWCMELPNTQMTLQVGVSLDDVKLL